MKKIFTLLFISILSVTVSAQVFWTEDFGSTCRFRGHADTYVGTNGAWTVTSIGQNDTYGNDWFVNDRSNFNGVGNCATGNDLNCQTVSNNTLHVGGKTMPAFTIYLFGIPILSYPGAPEDSSSYWTGYFGSLDATYTATTNKRVESPTISCSGKSSISVSFDYFEGGDGSAGPNGGPNGNCTLWYYDGASWSQIDPIAKTASAPCGSNLLGIWTASPSYTLPSSANNNANVKIGFNWSNNTTSGGSDPSFAVDNIKLSTAGAANPPVAKIARTDSVGCSPYCITGLTDNSTNSPTSWLWTFTGGSPSSSTLQNPGPVCYTTGDYSVKLKVTNAGGTDSVTLTNLIHINGSPLTPTITRHGADTLCSSTDASYISYNWIYGTSTASGNTPCIKITSGSGNYTVKVKNSNQCEAASQITVGLEGYSFDNKVSIYPSPATHELTVTGNWQASDGKFSVYDIIGKKVKDYDVRLEDKMLVNVKDLPAGMYFIKIENEKGSWTGKFEKE